MDNLRLAIPRIIEPFYRPPTPTTFKLYSQGVVGAQNGVKALSEQWRSPEVQETLRRAERSLAANADLSASVSLPSHGWVERERREREAKKGLKKGRESVEDMGAVLGEADVLQIVAEFRKAHPNIRLDAQDDGRSISVCLPRHSHPVPLADTADAICLRICKVSVPCYHRARCRRATQDQRRVSGNNGAVSGHHEMYCVTVTGK